MFKWMEIFKPKTTPKLTIWEEIQILSDDLLKSKTLPNITVFEMDGKRMATYVPSLDTLIDYMEIINDTIIVKSNTIRTLKKGEETTMSVLEFVSDTDGAYYTGQYIQDEVLPTINELARNAQCLNERDYSLLNRKSWYVLQSIKSFLEGIS